MRKLTSFAECHGRWQWDVTTEDGGELRYQTDRQGDGLWMINDLGDRSQIKGTLQFQVPYVPSEEATPEARAWVRARFGYVDETQDR